MNEGRECEYAPQEAVVCVVRTCEMWCVCGVWVWERVGWEAWKEDSRLIVD